MPGDDAAVEFRRAGVDRDRVALGGIADVLHALVEQHLQDRAAVIGRAADQEIVGGIAPVFLQPFDVGFKTAGRRHQRRGADFGGAADRLLQRGGQEHAVLDLEVGHFSIVDDLDAEFFRGEIQRVQHRASAAEEERIGAAKAQRAAERGLPAHALFDDPVQDVLGLLDHELGEFLVGLTAGQAQQIVPELFLGVGAGEDRGRGIMRATHVAGVAGIAAAIEFWRAFQHQHRGAGAPGADRGAQGGVTAADDKHIEFLSEVDHALLLSLLAWKSNRRSAGQVHPSRRFSSLLKRPRHASRAIQRSAASCDDVACAGACGISAASGLALDGREQPLPEGRQFWRIGSSRGRDQIEAGIDRERDLEGDHQASLAMSSCT